MTTEVENNQPVTREINGETVDVSHLSETEIAALDKADGAVGDDKAPTLDELAGGEASDDNPKDDRPEWLDEKFESPEDLAKAYKELQAKLGEKPKEGEDGDDKSDGEDKPDGEEADDKPAGTAEIDYERYTKSLTENGELSADDYATLESQGFPKEVVDVYVAGIQAQTAAKYAPVIEAAGGEDSYNELIDWAGANLSEADGDAYDTLIQQGGTVGAAAIKQLAALHAESTGSEAPNPSALRGNAGRETIEPFQSQAEVTAAMRDPAYKTDPAYQAKVARRLAASNF